METRQEKIKGFSVSLCTTGIKKRCRKVESQWAELEKFTEKVDLPSLKAKAQDWIKSEMKTSEKAYLSVYPAELDEPFVSIMITQGNKFHWS